MSVFHFARSFKQAMGTPPHQYLTELRIAEACSLLREGTRCIGEAAQAVGLTHSHFSVVFLRRPGMTSTQFREVQRG